MDKVRARIKQKGLYAQSTPAACSSERRAGWALSRFNSPVLGEVPGVVFCAQGEEEGICLHISRYGALLAPRIGAQPFLANQSFAIWMSGDHNMQYKSAALMR